MDFQDFIKLVREVREAQKLYYRFRRRPDLITARVLEKRLDEILKDENLGVVSDVQLVMALAEAGD